MRTGAAEDASYALAANVCEDIHVAQLSEDSDGHSPIEGGWGACLGVFVVNFLTVGQQNSAWVVYDAILDEYSTPRGETGILV